MSDGPDIVIIGSGHRRRPRWRRPSPPSGRRIVILERGERLADCPEARDDRRDLRARPLPPGRDLARRPRARRSTRATTTMSAATPSSTARCCSATAPRISARSAISAARRRAGRSPTTTSSPGTRRPRSCIGVRGDARAGPDRAAAFRRAIPFRRCRTSPASPRCGRGSRRAGVHAVVAAARDRPRRLAEAGGHALGRLSRHDRRQERRRDASGIAKALAASERDAGDRRAGDPAGRRRGRPDHRGRIRARTARRGGCRAATRGACGRGGELGRAAAALGARQPLRPGRAQLHEPQLLGGDGGASRSAATTRSIRRPSRSTTST